MADEGEYLRSLALFIDPYEEVKKSIGSRASSAVKHSRANARSS